MLRRTVIERRAEAQRRSGFVTAGRSAHRRDCRRDDAEIVDRRLVHALQQVVDHVCGAPGGGGASQVPELFLLGHHEGCDQLADRPREGGHQRCLRIQAGAFVADHRHALAELLDQRRTAHRAEQVFGADLVLVVEQLAIQHRGARQHQQAAGALVAARHQLCVQRTLKRHAEGKGLPVAVELARLVGAEQQQ